MSYQWVQKLNESNSRLHKEEVVRQVYAQAQLGDQSAINFLNCVYAAYSPFVTFGVKQVPESISSTVSDNDTDWEAFADLQAKLQHRQLTGHAARDAIVNVMSRMSSNAWNNLARLVLIKDLRAGATETTFNKILKGSKYAIPVFKCQLAEDVHKYQGALSGQKQLQVKLDGVRVLAVATADSVVMYSRNGLVFENFKKVEEDIRNILWPRAVAANPHLADTGVVFDGEVVSRTFNKLMTQARRKKNAAADDSVYHIFDMVPFENFFRDGYYNMSQAERTKKLSRVLPASFKEAKHLALVPHLDIDLDTAAGRETMDKFMADSVAAGFEGIMIKDAKAPYECTRGTFWLKQKPWIEVSLTIVGVEEGTGKNKGKLGALVCAGVDDGVFIETNVGSGFSDSMREELWKHRDLLKDCVAEIRADSISQNQDGTNSLRFPRFKTLRGFEPGQKL